MHAKYKFWGCKLPKPLVAEWATKWAEANDPDWDPYDEEYMSNINNFRGLSPSDVGEPRGLILEEAYDTWNETWDVFACAEEPIDITDIAGTPEEDQYVIPKNDAAIAILKGKLAAYGIRSEITVLDAIHTI